MAAIGRAGGAGEADGLRGAGSSSGAFPAAPPPPAPAARAPAAAPATGLRSVSREELLRAMAIAVGKDLEGALTPERARALFGASADATRACLLRSSGPARDALAETIQGPGALRAAQTYQRLLAVPQAGGLPPEAQAILVRAAATPRSPGANGREGILSPLQAQNAALAWKGMSASERASVQALLDTADISDRPDATPAQALVLKALAARRGAFEGSDAAARAKAISELTGFSKAICGMSFSTLMQRTSLLDIDETTNARAFAPISLEDRAGAPAERPLIAGAAGDDGLYQRYAESCGPASIEVLLGEADPVYALRRRSGDFGVNPAAGDDIQSAVVKEFGLTTESRVVPPAIVRLRSAMAALQSQGRLSPEMAAQVSSYLLGTNAPKGPLVDRGLAIVRGANGGFPDASLAQMIHDYQPPGPDAKFNNIGFDNVTRLLNRYVGNELGTSYELKSLYASGQGDPAARSAAFVRGNLDQLERNLADGQDVVFGTSYPDHFWSMSSVEGQKPARRFLVHDVWTGRTQWVPEQKLVDGSFARAFLGESKTSTFVDLMYLVT